MSRRKMTSGEKGWIGLVAYVLVVDSLAWANQVRGLKKDETMSVAWGRWLQHPRARYLTGIAWATMSLHLFLSWPLPGEKTLKHFVQALFRKKGNGKVRIDLSMQNLQSYEVRG